MQAPMTMPAVRGADEVALRLARLFGDAPLETPRLHPIAPAAPPRRTVAIDGSSVVLAETGEAALAAYRAGGVALRGVAPEPATTTPVEIVLIAASDAASVVAERLERAGFAGHALPRLRPEAALDALRTLEELRCGIEALDAMQPGDLLLLDGPLQARGAVPLIDALLARASERGVDVVGVCKSTSLTIGPVPALVACQLAGRQSTARTWRAPLLAPPSVRGETHAARLSPAEERVFRFDVAAADHDAARVLASLAGLCGHPAYPGYPSPLAMAHNAVLLNEDARRRLRGEVHEAALRAGVDERAWELAFVDYHDVLHLGA